MTPTTTTSALAIRAKSRIASSFAHNPSNMPPIASSSARNPRTFADCERHRPHSPTTSRRELLQGRIRDLEDSVRIPATEDHVSRKWRATCPSDPKHSPIVTRCHTQEKMTPDVPRSQERRASSSARLRAAITSRTNPIAALRSDPGVSSSAYLPTTAPPPLASEQGRRQRRLRTRPRRAMSQGKRQQERERREWEERVVA